MLGKNILIAVTLVTLVLVTPSVYGYGARGGSAGIGFSPLPPIIPQYQPSFSKFGGVGLGAAGFGGPIGPGLAGGSFGASSLGVSGFGNPLLLGSSVGGFQSGYLQGAGAGFDPSFGLGLGSSLGIQQGFGLASAPIGLSDPFALSGGVGAVGLGSLGGPSPLGISGNIDPIGLSAPGGFIGGGIGVPIGGPVGFSSGLGIPSSGFSAVGPAFAVPAQIPIGIGGDFDGFDGFGDNGFASSSFGSFSNGGLSSFSNGGFSSFGNGFDDFGDNFSNDGFLGPRLN